MSLDYVVRCEDESVIPNDSLISLIHFYAKNRRRMFPMWQLAKVAQFSNDDGSFFNEFMSLFAQLPPNGLHLQYFLRMEQFPYDKIVALMRADAETRFGILDFTIWCARTFQGRFDNDKRFLIPFYTGCFDWKEVSIEPTNFNSILNLVTVNNAIYLKNNEPEKYKRLGNWDNEADYQSDIWNIFAARFLELRKQRLRQSPVDLAMYLQISDGSLVFTQHAGHLRDAVLQDESKFRLIYTTNDLFVVDVLQQESRRFEDFVTPDWLFDHQRKLEEQICFCKFQEMRPVSDVMPVTMADDVYYFGKPVWQYLQASFFNEMQKPVICILYCPITRTFEDSFAPPEYSFGNSRLHSMVVYQK